MRCWYSLMVDDGHRKKEQSIRNFEESVSRHIVYDPMTDILWAL